MALTAAAVTLYLLTMTVQPETGQDVEQIFVNIAKELYNTTGVTFVYKFKVVGESRALAVVEVSNVAKLERIVNKLYKLGPVETTNKPIITYEDFGRNLGVSDELTNQNYTVLNRKNVFYFEVYVDYYGNTTDQLLATWTRSVERALTRKRDGNLLQVFKSVAVRKFHCFVSNPDTLFLDRNTFEYPIVEDFGSNIHFYSNGLVSLDEYVASIKNENVY
ncbi:hypothetical protein BsWGS_10331 [Bradybaena similaris]